MKIFGRDPALWASLFSVLISGAGAFVFHFNTDQEGALNGLITAAFGIVVWYVTKNGGPALILGLVKAAIFTAAAWHFNLPADKQTILLTLTSVLVAMFVRTQITAPVPPEPTPADKALPVTIAA
jgi:hypothetical protein